VKATCTARAPATVQDDRGSNQGTSRGAEVIKHHDHPIGDFSYDTSRRHHVARPALLDERECDLTSESPFEQLSKDLSSFDAAHIRRRHRDPVSR
jgi:hypothetical protein